MHSPAPQGIASTQEVEFAQQEPATSRKASDGRNFSRLSDGSTSKSALIEPLPHTPNKGHSFFILMVSERYSLSKTLSSSTKTIRSAAASRIPRRRAHNKPSSLSIT